ncbi:universal stress protein [Oceanibium sediminis]|uniref:universal stress protein n=1 Tax=Oceanibium sediminis TaxID=2026339 RepID=UPI000DD43E47|nr:universal stress protein [Oceanibium sediminis]
MIDKILLAVDGSENAQRALDVASELALNLDAALFIVHVLMHGSPPKELMRMAEVEHIIDKARTTAIPQLSLIAGERFDLLETTLDDQQTARVITAMGEEILSRAENRARELEVREVSTHVRVGDRAEEILDAAKEHAVDMIVIGSRGLGTIRGAVLGSVSQKVLHHGEGCILTVK